jgi:hypothetical protein
MFFEFEEELPALRHVRYFYKNAHQLIAIGLALQSEGFPGLPRATETLSRQRG